MLNTMSQWFLGAPARLVRSGLWMFFAGTGALFGSLLAQLGVGEGELLAERFPQLPTWFVPETPAGFTLAVTLVCWGVWAMGTGLKLAREGSNPQ